VSVPTSGQQDLLLLPYTNALEALKDRTVRLAVITPGYPALGRGSLHVVRVRDDGDAVVVEATYDDFERLT
jgi:hypothetical protein